MAKQRQKETFGKPPGRMKKRGDLEKLREMILAEGVTFEGAKPGRGMPGDDCMACFRAGRAWCPEGMPAKQAITIACGEYWKMWRKQE
jgi:hypothetical protein